MRGTILLREAELVAREPIVDVFPMTQSRNRVIVGGTFSVLILGFGMFNYDDFIDQMLVGALVFGVVSLFLRSTFITITSTRALLMESGRVLPFPSRIVRTFGGGEVTFIRDRFGESIQIDGKSFNAGKGWGRLRSLMCDEEDAATTAGG